MLMTVLNYFPIRIRIYRFPAKIVWLKAGTIQKLFVFLFLALYLSLRFCLFQILKDNVVPISESQYESFRNYILNIESVNTGRMVLAFCKKDGFFYCGKKNQKKYILHFPKLA